MAHYQLRLSCRVTNVFQSAHKCTHTHTKHLHILLTLSLFYVLQVSLLTVTLVHYIYYIHHSAMVSEVVEQLLQKHNQQGHVDVSLLAAWEQVRD